jgi:threonine/homoserine/homoserine lactone efflux protein
VLTIRNTLAGGTRDGIWTVAGICSGFIFKPLLAALGVAALFIKLPLVFAAVKSAGALCLVYLGGLWKARYREVPVDVRTNSDSWKRYPEGLLTNALNPKIAVFYFAVLPTVHQNQRSRPA